MPSPVAARPLRRIADLPGPRGLPWLGNALQVRPATMHRSIEDWRRVYGDLFRVRLGARTLVAVADPDAINSVLRERPERFRRSSRLAEVGLEMGGAPGLFGAEGEAWRRQRRMVMASFAPNHVRAYFPSLLVVALRLRARWSKAARTNTPIDLQADLKRFTVDAIAGVAFGAEVNTLESGEDRIQRHLDLVLDGLYRRVMSPLPYWRWIRLPRDRRIERSNAALRDAIEGFICNARARLQAEPDRREHPRNLLEAMLAAADGGAAGVDDRDVAGNVSTMLFAGEDTTANTLAWLIWLLYRHPATLERARGEVRQVAPELEALTQAQLDRLDYLEACASEAMRLEPVAPFLVAEALHDTVVAGVQCPKGTVLWCLLRGASVDERHVPNAAAFDPERWIGDVKALKRVAMPFGSGPRICPGRYLALLEIKLAAVMLLGAFEIDAVEPADGDEVEEVMHFTMNPTPLRMRLREVQPASTASA
jgi:cytochrome P450